MAAMTPILSTRGLSKSFGGLRAVHNVDFDLEEGQVRALIGPNGAGKTTVFNCVTGFYKPSEGMITLRQRNGQTFLLERMADHEISHRA